MEIKTILGSLTDKEIIRAIHNLKESESNALIVKRFLHDLHIEKYKRQLLHIYVGDCSFAMTKDNQDCYECKEGCKLPDIQLIRQVLIVNEDFDQFLKDTLLSIAVLSKNEPCHIENLCSDINMLIKDFPILVAEWLYEKEKKRKSCQP